jgi:hypothetical protein
MGLPSADPSSIKAAIIELVKQGGLSNRQIARRTGSTKNYVAKVKSIYNRRLNSLGDISAPSFPSSPSLQAGQQDDVGDGGTSTNSNQGNNNGGGSKNSDDTGDSSGGSDNTNSDQTRLLKGGSQYHAQAGAFRTKSKQHHHHATAPAAIATASIGTVAISAEDRKKLWTAFDAQRSLVDIIKEYGYPLHLVEREYLDFLHCQGISLKEMQGNIIMRINQSRDYFIDGLLSDDVAKQYEELAEAYRNRGYVGTKQFLSLLEIYRQVALLDGKKLILSDGVSEPLMEGWARPLCHWCHKPLPGVIYDATRLGIDYIKDLHVDSPLRAHHIGCPDER